MDLFKGPINVPSTATNLTSVREAALDLRMGLRLRSSYFKSGSADAPWRSLPACFLVSPGWTQVWGKAENQAECTCHDLGGDMLNE